MGCNDCPEDSTRELTPGDKGTKTLVNEGKETIIWRGRDGREYHFKPDEPVAVMNWDIVHIMLGSDDLEMVEVLRG